MRTKVEMVAIVAIFDYGVFQLRGLFGWCGIEVYERLWRLW